MIEAWVIACVLILFRVTAFVMFMPPLAGQGLPATVKVGLSVALTAMWVTVHSGAAAVHLYLTVSGSTAWIQLGFLVLRETLLGIGLAWLFGLCMVPVRTAGAWIAQEMGLTIAGLTSPMDQQPTNVVSQCLEALGVLMFFALNLHHVVFFALGRTFDVRPVGTGWLIPSWDNVVDAVSRSINQGLLIIAPIGILLFITLLILLVTIRTAPQFNFMSYGMTLRLIVGMLGLVVFFPELAGGMRLLLSQLGEGVIY